MIILRSTRAIDLAKHRPWGDRQLQIRLALGTGEINPSKSSFGLTGKFNDLLI